MSKLYQRKGLQKVLILALGASASVPSAFALGPNIASAISTLYKLGLPVAIVIGLALIIINGYGIMTSEGDPRKVQTAKENLFSAIMGLVFVLLALVIYRVIVSSLFGLTL